MIRFILIRRWKDQNTGLETNTPYTLDVDLPLLERLLQGGGISETGYDYTELLGAEVLPATEEGTK